MAPEDETSSQTNTAFSYEAFPQQQSIRTSFQVPERKPCTVTFTVEPDHDQERNGIPQLVRSMNWPSPATGFPAAHATVSSPESRGYASMYGWVQVTADTAENTSAVLDLSSATWNMDPIPITKDLNTPFTWFGPEPTLFDGPFMTDRSISVRLDWLARSFLCYVPDNLLSKHVKPILGFQWGFWIEDSEPRVKQLEQIDLEKTWNEHLDLFRTSFPGWKFDDSAA